ncbi:MAG: phage tail tip lysozyme [Pseudolabrys sp.]
MAIVRKDFAEECVGQALFFGINPHYIVAVAELLSGINDDKADDKIGPFRVTLSDWQAKGSDPEFEIGLQPDEIEFWESQCAYAALQTLRAQRQLVNGAKYPSADQLYAVWPNAPVPEGKSLQKAIETTKDLILPAVDAMLAGLSPSVVNNIKLNALSAAKQGMANLIIDAFANAGYGKIHQIAAVANAIAESNLDPKARSKPPEDSVGLFQLNRNGGVGTGHTVKELQDPAKNTALIIAECNKVPQFKAANNLPDAVSIFVRKIERPANADGEVVKRLAIAQKIAV